MSIWLDIASMDGAELPQGGSLRIEVRDASWADAPARVLHRLETQVPLHASLFPVELRLDTLPADAIVWVHLDADGDGRVSAGDYITTQSYPLTSRTSGRMRVELRRIG
jgi:uncharacterized lipoprotein YbaY